MICLPNESQGSNLMLSRIGTGCSKVSIDFWINESENGSVLEGILESNQVFHFG